MSYPGYSLLIWLHDPINMFVNFNYTEDHKSVSIQLIGNRLSVGITNDQDEILKTYELDDAKMNSVHQMLYPYRNTVLFNGDHNFLTLIDPVLNISVRIAEAHKGVYERVINTLLELIPNTKGIPDMPFEKFQQQQQVK